MRILLLVGLGSFVGGVLRHAVSLLFNQASDTKFPYATFAVNIIGSFLIGAILAISDRGSISGEWKYFLSAGICGGFTTFSAFSLQSLNLLRNGMHLLGVSYMLLSVVLGILACYGGYLLLKS